MTQEKKPSPFAVLFLDEESKAGSPEGGEIQRIAGSLAQSLKPWIVDPNVTNYEGKAVVLREAGSEGPEIAVILGKTLGTGWFGTAYRIEPLSIAAAEWLEVEVADALVAKVPHALKTIVPSADVPLGIARRANQREARTYRLFMDNLAQIESRYPRPPSWRPGGLPVVPILREIDTSFGTVLIKPEVKGLTLANLRTKFGAELPSEMIEGLRDIYSLVQAIHQEIQVPVWRLNAPFRHQEGLSVDIRPTNLIWIEDLKLQRQLRLIRPGFVLFELDQVPQNFPQYIAEKSSFDAYLAEFHRYLLKDNSEN